MKSSSILSNDPRRLEDLNSVYAGCKSALGRVNETVKIWTSPCLSKHAEKTSLTQSSEDEKVLDCVAVIAVLHIME
jgi:hypothetical protein